MTALLLFCHGFMYDPGAATWLWLLPAAAVSAGFTISLANLVRQMKGSNR